MIIKRFFAAAALLALAVAPAHADFTFEVLSKQYNSTTGNIEWIFAISDTGTGVQLDLGDAVATEIALQLTNDGLTAGFNPTIMDPITGNQSNNGTGVAAGDTYYYLTTDGTTFNGVQGTSAGTNQLWVANPYDILDQNSGTNPFTGTKQDGLNVDIAAGQIFAALGTGSTVSTAIPTPSALPNPLRVLHVASTDGSFDFEVLISNGGNTTGTSGNPVPLTGSFTSIVKGDMTGNTVADGSDIDAFLGQIFGLGGVAAGLDGNARADITNNGLADGSDLDPFLSLIFGLGASGQLTAGTTAVPEPSSLVVLAGLISAGVAFHRRK